MSEVLSALQQMIEQRIGEADADNSYVASLHRQGLNKILEKVGEECGDKQSVICETADLWFHSLVMLAALGESVDSVLSELQRRAGTSGIEEKLSRKS